LLLVAAFFVIPFVVSFFNPWSGINCSHQDIDITTGQARYSRQFWFVQVSERIEDTYVSRAAGTEPPADPARRQWHRVNTFSPWISHSPHYRFHAALSQVRLLEVIVEYVQIPADQEQQVARGLLDAWQRGSDDSDARDYLRALEDNTVAEHDP
jgi:hypothetical protein